jgi:hypothetical protein
MLNIFYYKLLHKYSDNVINLNKKKTIILQFVYVIISLIA